jgi:hypothetical protein
MPVRENATPGSPCWTDLWTSDVEGSRAFYSALFGWEAQEPSPEFGGYFMFTRNGVPVAGGMGDMGDVPADNSWKIYLDTDDLTRTLQAAQAQGAQVLVPATPVADLGVQAVLLDPTGAVLGAWQAGTFPGFTVLEEPGTPSWFELHTTDHARAVGFYPSVFALGSKELSDTDEFRYSVLLDEASNLEVAGIYDATRILPEGTTSQWTTYWEVEDTDAALATVIALGGSLVTDAADSPYGRMATVQDPSGATFRLRTAPR